MSVLRVVLPIDGEEDLRLVEEACDLARRHHARLELISGIFQPWFTVSYGYCRAQLERELQEHSCALLSAALELVPHDVCVLGRQSRGSARRAARAEARPGDLAVVRRSSRRDRRAWGQAGVTLAVITPEALPAPAVPVVAPGLRPASVL